MRIPKFPSLLFTFALLATAVCATCAAGPSRYPMPATRLTAAFCPPLAPPTGPTVTVSTEAELRDRAHNAAPGTTILIQPGVYALQDFIYVVNDGLALRGASGDRDDVVLDFGGMVGGHFGILVDADDVTVADLTIRNAADHGVSIQGRDRPLLYNLHILDIGDQLVKVNPAGDGSDDGLLACSLLEYTTTAPDEYTNGISAHDAHGWTVRDNEWRRIRTPGNNPVPAILFWSGSSDTVVERNLLVDCYQGIAFGNASHGPGDHTGGVVRNNMIYASLPHDSVIEMVHASGWLVAHNTAWLLKPAPGLTWGMEARFSDTSGTFAYNLTNMAIWLDRDGANATGTGNLTAAEAAWFADAANGDLHLVGTASEAIDHAAALPEVPDDFDGDARPVALGSDVGADEFTGFPPPSPTPSPTPTPSAWIYLPLVLKGWPAPTPTPTIACTPPACATDEVYHCPDLCPGGCGIVCATPTPSATPSAGDLLQPGDLTYRGAFAYPAAGEWAYSGHALTYYPNGDPDGPHDGHPGSLYAAGHTGDDLVGEIAIPAPVVSTHFDDLPQAAVLRPLADLTGGWKDNCTYNDDCIYREVDGLAYLPNVNKIAWNLRDWYNAGGYDQDSLGWSDLDMSDAQGVWHIGARPSEGDIFHNAKTCNYLFLAPQGFADQYLGGRWLIAGNHRQAGAFGGSQGPTLYALAPWEDGNPPSSGQNLDALALLYYPEIYPGCLDDPDTCYFPDYRPADDWGGGAWVQTVTKRGILIVGQKGLGDNCYGAPGSTCGPDPCNPYQGYHAYPYEPQILFYDPQELAEVVAGTRQPWEVVPYALYRPTGEVLNPECGVLGDAAYDRERGFLYVTEREAGPWGETVVHVWEIGE